MYRTTLEPFAGSRQLEAAGQLDPSTLGEPTGIAGLLDVPTGGDARGEGRIVVLRTYVRVLLWYRSEGATVAETLVDAEPCEAPAPRELQGEAIALLPNDAGYVTVSEGRHPAVNWFALEPS